MAFSAFGVDHGEIAKSARSDKRDDYLRAAGGGAALGGGLGAVRSGVKEYGQQDWRARFHTIMGSPRTEPLGANAYRAIGHSAGRGAAKGAAAGTLVGLGAMGAAKASGNRAKKKKRQS